MRNRIKVVIATTAIAMVLAVVPAMADDGDENESLGTNSPLAMLLAGEFGMTEDEVIALREEGLGFGEIFKLKTLAIALGTDIETLLANATVDPETGEYEFDFGELKKSLTEEQLALLESLPKNFGQIVSAYNRAKHGEHHGKPEWAGSGKPEGAGHGKPPWAGEGDDEEGDDED